ncbi:MAG TPA: potassium channel protein [Longimicrobiales bacterium]|nr:potassium channel protein [Longimicrobiales bacterium]
MERLRSGLTEPVQQLKISLLLLVLLVAIGTLGYVVLEAMSPLDGLYMTIITLTTVGFREVRELDAPGKVFTIFLLLSGVVIGAWAIRNAVEATLGQAFWSSVQRRRIRGMLESLRGHYIVCGYGRLGRHIVRDLQARGEAYVVIDANPALEEELLAQRLPFVLGDATLEESLRAAAIERAQGLVAALDSDANNVLTVLTARELKPALQIVARANSEALESRLLRAGADRVIAPDSIGGHRMALALLRPAVDDFFGRVFNLGVQPEVDVGQVTITPGSPFAGQTVAACDLRRVRNVSILAIQTTAGAFDLNVQPERIIEPGETLILLGPAEAIYDLEALYSSG